MSWATARPGHRDDLELEAEAKTVTTSRADVVDELIAAALKEWKRGRGTREYAAFLMAEAQVAATLTVAAEIRELNRKLEGTS